MKPYKIEDKFLTPEARRAPPGPPLRPKRYDYEADQSDPWDASNEPDGASPLMMIQPGAEDMSAEDNADLDGWIDARMLDERMVPRVQDRVMLEDDPNASEYLADDALDMTAGMRGEKTPVTFDLNQRFGDGDKERQMRRRR